jgi:hypothetical protein
MATAKRAMGARRIGAVRIALAIALALAVASFFWGGKVHGLTQAGTAYGAKNACSCRFLAHRELDSCYADFVPGMETVFLSEDAEDRAVTAWIPLLASNTAHFSEGSGCVLDRWED